MSTTAQGYTLTLLQRPGSDFYDTTLEITNPAGVTQSVWVDYDDCRWWAGRIEQNGKLIWFRRAQGFWFLSGGGKEVWFDPKGLRVGRTGDQGISIQGTMPSSFY